MLESTLSYIFANQWRVLPICLLLLVAVMAPIVPASEVASAPPELSASKPATKPTLIAVGLTGSTNALIVP